MTTKEDLILAWRKAKVDLYYATNPPLFAIADYETNLLENLEQLQERINSVSTDGISDEDFLGGWTLVPKAICPTAGPNKTEKSSPADHATKIVFAAPQEEWEARLARGEKPIAEFRLMARCSMDFHVLSALWMLKVGASFDKQLSDCVYGSRLRRNRKGEVNEMALGSFKPYLKPFRDWRDGAINAMHSALANKKSVVALTADVSSFYHRLNAGFMLNANFQEKIGVELGEEQSRLNKLFITAVQEWAKETPLKTGLPVGLPASAVIANAALFELDRFVEQQVVPLYYGRYVDDILLVIRDTTHPASNVSGKPAKGKENISKFSTSNTFWEWLIDRDGGEDLLEQKDGSILFQPAYLEDCKIAFENSKNKLFLLSGGSGSALVNAIREQIHQRASEWRALPNLPTDPKTIATDLLKATNSEGEPADNLRKTDVLALHRAGFALRLRDYEAFERDLPPDAWQEHRHAFFDAVIDHVLTPVKYFELQQYVPRVVRMATVCGDFKHLGRMLERLDKLFDAIKRECSWQIKAMEDPDGYGDAEQTNIKAGKDEMHWRNKWRLQLCCVLVEAILSAFPSHLTTALRNEWQEEVEGWWRKNLKRLSPIYQAPHADAHNIRDLQKLHAYLFCHDLAHIPLRFAGLPKELDQQRSIPTRDKLVADDWAETGSLDIDSAGFGEGIRTLAGWFRPELRKGIPPGLYFPTRPFNLSDLYLIAPTPFNKDQLPVIGKVTGALRGFDPTEHKLPQWDKKGRRLQISHDESKAQQTIAVSSWLTDDASYVAAVMRQPDPSGRQRYQRLNRLVNELISRPDRANYLVLPELAVPPRWFMRIARKLKGRGISFITGVEYLHARRKRRKRVRNQIWAALIHDGLGFPSLLVYRQDKQTSALGEEKELFRLAGVSLKPALPWEQPPVIEHGDFSFALLVCSELTNIHYRAALRGEIDALFALEWNRDVDTFNALVESAALDIHTYIIQCNNRCYGDSRIRAPYQDRWKRDVLRVKGGNHDYCITGEIDVQALRRFQNSHRSPHGPFKPVPDGFKIARERQVLPMGEME